LAYQESTSEDRLWRITRKGLQITALHDQIGVRVLSQNVETEAFLTALDDDVIGTQYAGNAVSK